MRFRRPNLTIGEKRRKGDREEHIIDAWLEQNKHTRPKQRQSGQRIYERLRDEYDFTGHYGTVQRYIKEAANRQKEVFMPLQFEPGEEARVDWHQGWVFDNGIERKCQLFSMRLCYSKVQVKAAVGLCVQRRAFHEEAVLNVLRNEPLPQRAQLDLSDRPELANQSNGVRDTGIYDQLKDSYEQTSLIVTTNLPFADWPQVLAEDERLAGALLDGLTHHVHILEIVGDRCRLKSSLEKGKEKQE